MTPPLPPPRQHHPCRLEERSAVDETEIDTVAVAVVVQVAMMTIIADAATAATMVAVARKTIVVGCEGGAATLMTETDAAIATVIITAITLMIDTTESTLETIGVVREVEATTACRDTIVKIMTEGDMHAPDPTVAVIRNRAESLGLGNCLYHSELGVVLYR
jgi:hypothetical protein